MRKKVKTLLQKIDLLSLFFISLREFNKRKLCFMKQLEYQSGFGAIAVLLIGVVIAVFTFTGYVIYKHQLPTHRNSTSSNTGRNTTPPDSNATIKTNPPTQVSPTAFVTILLDALASENEIQLEQLLTPAFKNFRQQRLAAGPCNGPHAQSLTCDSLLNTTVIQSFSTQSPAITDFTFKDGQKGKSVTYESTQEGSDPGTTYYSFKLLPNNNSYLLNDYIDVFVEKGLPEPNPLLGSMESSR